ncbi:Oligoribonuclease, partial [Bienertia sinuspersici]
GPEFVIHQSQECMDRMNDWCQDHHGKSGKKCYILVWLELISDNLYHSGLTEKVLKSTVSELDAEKQVCL